ncbi:MAG TPA: HAMP domain-containing sensor histidine kinase, partial [Ktedonobacteraceae bacterium]|nr:HAMP domain-containing sensor histidine kinase [Ktedonobacteraceae bacterium]
MLAQIYFHEVVQRVRDLLGCGSALFALDCPEPELCHPLLEWLPLTGAAYIFGSAELQILLQDEQVRALRDDACQSGQMRSINGCRLLAGELLAQSVAIVPVERPAGVLGYFVLVDAFAGEFTVGDARLLHDYLQTIQFDFESEVRTRRCIADVGARFIAPVDAEMNSSTRRAARGLTDGLKSDLVSMVSHELRAPLTAIKGYAGLLQAYSVKDRQRESEREATMTPARQQQYLDIIMEQARHLEVLMGDLLDVSRIQAGKLALRFTEVDVGLICQQVTRLAQQRIDQQLLEHHSLHCDVSPELPLMWVDANRLQQILNNLLDNAIKYSPGGGLIELRACVEYAPFNAHPVAQITISDQGIGINAQQYARLFRPFSRLDHEVTSQVQGAGLGLYITQKLVEAMEGTIELT